MSRPAALLFTALAALALALMAGVPALPTPRASAQPAGSLPTAWAPSSAPRAALLPTAAAGTPAAADAAALRFAQPLPPARDCKPQAHVALELKQTGVSDGSVVELAFFVLPGASLQTVAWELQLPPGAEAIEGATHGTCEPGDSSHAAPAGTGWRTARVRLAAQADLERITLTATAALARPGGDGDVVQAARSLHWGDPHAALAAALPGRRLLDVGGGPARRLALVPSRHRSGR